MRFHPWVFSGAIARIVLDADHRAAEPEEGELVRVVSAQQQVLGIGHWQVGSIAVRLLAFGVDTLPERFWHERIAAAYTMRQRLGLLREDNTIYRLIHGEGDMLPGLVVDIYGATAVVQAHSVGMHVSRHDIAQAIVEVTGVEDVYYKSDDTLPFKAEISEPKVGYLVESRKSKAGRSIGRRRMGWRYVLTGCGGRRRGSLSTSVRTAPWWSAMQPARMC